MKGPVLVQWGFSLVALYAAIAFVGKEVYIIATQGASAAIEYVPILPRVGIMGVSVIMFGVAYAGLIFPRYGKKSAWVLGLMWGLSEIVWNVEAVFLYPAALLPAVALPFWWLYIGGVCALFVASVGVLRSNLRLTKLTVAMLIVVILLSPLGDAVSSLILPGITVGSVTLPEVLAGQAPSHAFVIATALTLVRRLT